MKKRTAGFLSEENISHESEVFGYIQELHDYLWKFIRIANPEASGIIDDAIDSSLSKSATLRAGRDEAVRLLKEADILLSEIANDVHCDNDGRGCGSGNKAGEEHEKIEAFLVSIRDSSAR